MGEFGIGSWKDGLIGVTAEEPKSDGVGLWRRRWRRFVAEEMAEVCGRGDGGGL
ncbi:hypothetical protein Hanom_Chr14g01291681 [Helianthus anomalus]